MTRKQPPASVAKACALSVLLGLALAPVFPTGGLAAEGTTFERRAESLYAKARSTVVGITVRSLPRSRPRSEITHFGTGTVIDPVGLILTSTTVVPAGSRNIEVYGAGGRLGRARVVKIVAEKEISLLRVEDFSSLLPKGKKRLPFLRLGDSEKLRIGASAFSFGNAFHSIEADDQVVMAAGVISGRLELRTQHAESTYVGPVLETTAALNSGMDGGPLVDNDGDLVGLLILNFAKERWLGTAIPVDVLKPHLSAERSWFDDRSGGYPASAGIEVAKTAPDSGIRVLALAEGGPAKGAGLKVDDVVESIDGKALSSVGELHTFFQKARAGQKVRIGIIRAKMKSAIDVVLLGNF